MFKKMNKVSLEPHDWEVSLLMLYYIDKVLYKVEKKLISWNVVYCNSFQIFLVASFYVEP